MKILLAGLLSIGIAFAQPNFTDDDIATTRMLVVHTKYMYKYNISPTTQPNDLLKAIRVCIVKHMQEAGCNEILDSAIVKVLIDE